MGKLNAMLEQLQQICVSPSAARQLLPMMGGVEQSEFTCRTPMSERSGAFQTACLLLNMAPRCGASTAIHSQRRDDARRSSGDVAHVRISVSPA